MNAEPTVQWVAIERLIGHPLNSNRMPQELMDKLARHIQASGRYPPLIVRTLGASDAAVEAGPGRADAMQVIDGHHRLAVLRQLGHKLVRVDCWGDLTDGATELLLATLNRLEGRDDAELRADLLEHLRRTAEMDAGQLAALLPEDADALAALAKLRDPPPLPPAPPPPLAPLTVFLTAEQHKLARRAIEAATGDEALGAEGAALARICARFLES